MLAYIEHSGIQVIQQGMRFTFVIPDDAYFSKRTRELKTHQEKNIEALAYFIHDYIQFFKKPMITVTGYGDTVFYAPARDKISRHYAETIADILRENGVPSGVLVVKGKGARHPIGDNSYPLGASFNRRVEIVIR